MCDVVFPRLRVADLEIQRRFHFTRAAEGRDDSPLVRVALVRLCAAIAE